jgi:hypothetical protein
MDRRTAALAMALLRRVEIEPDERAGLYRVLAALAAILNAPDENRPDLVALRRSIEAQSGVDV